MKKRSVSTSGRWIRFAENKTEPESWLRKLLAKGKIYGQDYVPVAKAAAAA